MAEALPVIGLVGNALIWGLSWWPLRELQARGLHPLWATACIYGLALPMLLLWRRPDATAWRRQPMLWLLALAAGLTNVGFNWAVTAGDVVRVVLLFYLMPAWSVLLAWLLLGERPNTAALARLALALAGVSVVLKRPETPWPLPAGLADGLALAAGMAFALTNVLLRRLHNVSDGLRMQAMFAGGTVLGLAPALLGWLGGALVGPPSPQTGWLPLAGATAAAFVLANIGLQYGAARLAAGTTALVMLTEVVFASLSSVLLGAAELSARTLLGGALIVLAALWAAWPARVAAATG